MPVDSAVPVLLRKRQREREERKKISDVMRLMGHGGTTSMSQEHSPSCRHPLVQEIRTEEGEPQLDKERLIERLVLEEVMASIFGRCAVFSATFVFLMALMWLSFPASEFQPVHQTIIDGFELDTTFSDVKTVEDVQSYLVHAATLSHAFSPGSAMYVPDVQSKAFVSSPRTFPPAMELGHRQFPTLTASFSIAVWVKTKVRLDTIVSKEANGVRCWSFGPESVIFGEHDSHEPEVVVSPIAASLHRLDNDPMNAWKASSLKNDFADNRWHHVGFRVNATYIDFFLDSFKRGGGYLARPMTDCANGRVTIGSNRLVADLNDLVFYNRALTDTEFKEIHRAGRPMEVMLSGSGPQMSDTEYTLKQQLTETQIDANQRAEGQAESSQRRTRQAVKQILDISQESQSTSGGSVKDPEDNVKAAEDKPEFFGRYVGVQDQEQDMSSIEPEKYEKTMLCNDKVDPEACFEDVLSDALGGIPDVARVNSGLHITRRCKLTGGSLDDVFSTKFNASEIVESCFTNRNDTSTFSQKEISKIISIVRLAVHLSVEKKCRTQRKYRNECRATCGCARENTENHILTSSQCADDNGYRDYLDRGCSWYLLHDPQCSRYADDGTRSMCSMTCGTCGNKPQMDLSIVSVSELNYLFKTNHREDLLFVHHLAPQYVAYYCCVYQKYENGESSESCEESPGFPSVHHVSVTLRQLTRTAQCDLAGKYPKCFKQEYADIGNNCTTDGLNRDEIGFPREWISDSKSFLYRILLGSVYREIPRAVFMHVDGKSTAAAEKTRIVSTNVQQFSRNGSEVNFSLSVDRPEWEWKNCTTHDDCKGPLVFACRPSVDETYSACHKSMENGYSPQKQFCSETCWTGGCATHQKVCQPCDACESDTCSARCTIILDKIGVKNRTIAVDKQVQIFTNASYTTEDVSNSTWSISVWIKNFRYQYILQKTISVEYPGMDNWEAYDIASNQLTCYYLTISQFCFRHHWYDKKMTCIMNPLFDLLLDHEWHHLAVVQSIKRNVWKSDDESEIKLNPVQILLTFYVDGNRHGNRTLDHAVSDCGGPMVSSVEIRRFSDETVFGKDTRRFATDVHHLASVDFGHVLPMGANFSTMLRFSALQVPKGAFIKEAYLEFSAVENPVHQAMLTHQCVPWRYSNVKESLELHIFSPSIDIIVNPCNLTADICSNNIACYWDKSTCKGGVLGACPLKNYARSNHNVSKWNINVEQWRRTKLRVTPWNKTQQAFKEEKYDATTHSKSIRSSPNIANVVTEIVNRESYDPETSSAIIVLAATDNITCDGALPNREHLITFVRSFRSLKADVCSLIKTMNDQLNENFDLYALSGKGAHASKAGIAPTLRIHWCYTPDCVSPTFAGAGDDVKWGPFHFSVNESAGAPFDSSEVNTTNGNIMEPRTPKWLAEQSVVVGASLMQDNDVVSEGHLFDLRTISKAMTLGDVQAEYYSNLNWVPQLPGPDRVLDVASEESYLEVLDYGKEVVAIAPLVMFQQRGQRKACEDFVPALGKTMNSYFNQQIGKKCDPGMPYNCDIKRMSGETRKLNGLSCVDRESPVTTTTYFGREPQTFKGSAERIYFSEFLELMTIGTVYRDNKMQATRRWVDMQSSVVHVVSVFLAPSYHMATVLQLTFINSGAGKIETEYSVSSFKQMKADEQTIWLVLASLIFVGCLLEMCMIVSSWLCRMRDRARWVSLAMSDNCPSSSEDVLLEAGDVSGEQARQRERRLSIIRLNNTVYEFWDIFDLCLRTGIIVFDIVYVAHYFSIGLYKDNVDDQLGSMEIPLSEIMKMEWRGSNVTSTVNFDAMVTQFNMQIKGIVDASEFLLQMRLLGATLILLCLFRLIVFMRVHPRVAILYKTISTSLDDLFHFAITFIFLYFVLAFTATWTFGALDERYATFSASCYSQFNMIIGEFPMDPVPQMQQFYVAYLFVFCVLMFLTVMNFFLAIIIDSYAAIKEQVDECPVAENFLADLYHTFTFVWYSTKYGWPTRWQLIDSLLRADLDTNNINDEETQFVIAVKPPCLVKARIFPNLDVASAFVSHYLNISQELAGAKKANKNSAVLEHRVVLKRLLQLDLISHDIRGVHREVHPLGRRSDETRQLVKQLARLSQKILKALRVNKTQFSSERLLPEDGTGDAPYQTDMSVSSMHPQGISFTQ